MTHLNMDQEEENFNKKIEGQLKALHDSLGHAQGLVTDLKGAAVSQIRKMSGGSDKKFFTGILEDIKSAGATGNMKAAQDAIEKLKQRL